MHNRLSFAAATATAVLAALSAPAQAGTLGFNFEFSNLDVDLQPFTVTVPGITPVSATFGTDAIEFENDTLSGSFITDDNQAVITGDGLISVPFDQVFSSGVLDFDTLLPDGVINLGANNVGSVTGGGDINGAAFTTTWDDVADAFAFNFTDVATVDECFTDVCTLTGISTINLTGNVSGITVNPVVELAYTLTTTPIPAATDPDGTVPAEIVFNSQQLDPTTGEPVTGGGTGGGGTGGGGGATVPEPGTVAALAAVGGWMLKKRLDSSADTAA